MDGVTNKFAFLKAPKLKFERLEHEDEMAMNRYEFALFVQHENRTVPFQGEGRKAEVREARRRKLRGLAPGPRLPPVATHNPGSVQEPSEHCGPLPSPTLGAHTIQPLPGCSEGWEEGWG